MTLQDTLASPMNVYTIGYATKPIDTFISQLRQYHINVVVDIRSVPYSKVFFDYHKENIIQHLKRHNIRYVYLGDEFGPRSKDDSHYNEMGQIQFDRLMTSVLFQQGVVRLKSGIEKGFTVTLMCAEKDPIICHRSQLVGHYLFRHGLSLYDKNSLQDSSQKTSDRINLQHIRHDGTLESQDHLETRMMEIHDQGSDLFMSYDDRKHRAYIMQCQQTAYCKDC